MLFTLFFALTFALVHPGFETENWDGYIVPTLNTLVHINDMFEIFVLSRMDTPDDHWLSRRVFYGVWARAWSRRSSGIRSRRRSINLCGLYILCARTRVH